jgi:hypothetical protein
VAHNIGNAGSTLNGSISGASWSTNGKLGKALDFANSANNYVQIGNNNAINGMQEFTLSAWVYLDSYGESSGGRIIEKNGASDNGFSMWVNGTTISGVLFSAGGWSGTSGQWHTPIGSIQTGQWYQIVLTYSYSSLSNEAQFYINGKKVETIKSFQPTGSFATESNNVRIGANYQSPPIREFDGKIDEVKIYPFILTEDQVKVEYAQGSAQVMGALSTGVGGTSPSSSSSREYCVPGDTSTCNPPIGEWNMEENTGSTIYDKSGNNNSGTLGAGTSSPQWKQGFLGTGSGLLFDGVDDSVIISNNSILNIGTSDFTLSTWIKGKDMANGDVILGKTNGGGCSASYGFHFSVFDSLYPTLHFCTSGASHATIQGTQTLSNNQWYQIQIVVDRDSSTATQVYVNGQAVTTTVSNLSSHTGSISNTVNLAIGSESDGGFNWDGYIDQVKIYAYARTPAQVAWEFNRGAPLAHYKLDECTGSTIYDTSENKLNGTLSLGSNGVTSAGTCTTSGAWYNGAQGKHENSMSFDGSDDYVSVADNDLLDVVDGQDFSFSFWVNPPDLSGAKALFAKKTGNGATSTGYLVHLFANEVLGVYISDGTDQLYLTSKVALPTNTWNHVSVVYTDNTSVKLYVNGKDQTNLNSGTIANVDSLANGSPLVIGAESDFQLPFQGQIDEVKVFKYALTPAQVKTEMASGAVRFE